MNTPRSQSRTRIGIALSATLLGFALIGAASARDAQPPTFKVSYADLDLSRARDAQTLYMRLKQASATVCGSFAESSLLMQVAWQRCYKQALHNAVLTVNAPQLLAVYRHGTDVLAEPAG